MHQGAPPRRHAMRPAVRNVPHERVPPAIEIARVVVRPQPVLLGPVELEVGEEGGVEAGQDREVGGGGVDCFEVGAMLGYGLVPTLGDAGIVLPRVEEGDVGLVGRVEDHHGEGFAEVGDEARVDCRARAGFRRAEGVAGKVCCGADGDGGHGVVEGDGWE